MDESKIEVRLVLTRDEQPFTMFSGDVVDGYYFVALLTGDPEAELMSVNPQRAANFKALAKVFAHTHKVIVYNVEIGEIEAEYERVVPYSIEEWNETTAYGDYIRTR